MEPKGVKAPGLQSAGQAIIHAGLVVYIPSSCLPLCMSGHCQWISPRSSYPGHAVQADGFARHQLHL